MHGMRRAPALLLLCLLLPVYTITGYDASAHTSEETKNAAHSVPRGIVSAVFWSSLVGWIMICAIILAIPDMDAAAAQGWMTSATRAMARRTRSDGVLPDGPRSPVAAAMPKMRTGT